MKFIVYLLTLCLFFCGLMYGMDVKITKPIPISELQPHNPQVFKIEARQNTRLYRHLKI